MNVETVLQSVLASENPLTILLTIALIIALAVFGIVGNAVVRAITAIIPLGTNLVSTLHDLSERIGDQLDALKAIDDGTKQRTEKGIAVILEHNERAFAAIRKQADDNHAIIVTAIERLRIDVQLQLGNQRQPRYSEKDKET